MVTVYMAGIVYHHGCTTGTKRALVPNGTEFEAPHYASLFVEPNIHNSYDWWDGYRKDHPLPFLDDQGKPRIVIEFRIPTNGEIKCPAEITFPDDNIGPAQFTNLIGGLNKIKTTSPDLPFEIDTDHPETIAEVPIRGGQLTAYSFLAEKKYDVAVVKWTIPNDSDTITISATAGRLKKTLTLKNPRDESGLEVVFTNTADLFLPNSCDGDPKKTSHFMLYDKLNKHRPVKKPLVAVLPVVRLQVLQPSNPYLKFIQNGTRIADAQCAPTCC